MSYRLINANTIAESYTEVNDMPCIYADLPRGLDGGHYDMRGIDELQADNAKLREELAKWERLAAGIDLPEYPVTQFKPKDLERENAKLREFATETWELLTCNEPVFVWKGLQELARNLGIEVDA